MRQSMLTCDQSQLLRDEKEAFTKILILLSELGIPAESMDLLQKAILQLDELFLVVVVGEFNAGKSALVNAMLREKILSEGVTPTTAQVTLVKWGEQVSERSVDEGFCVYSYPLPLLKELNIVDSPGTNSINRIHERLTEEFVPRSDLILFVTSADRPLTESERLFLERILHWGKKVVFVVNKADIFENEEAREEVKRFVEENAAITLGTTPEVFIVSARMAQRAAHETDPERKILLRSDSNLDTLETYIADTLDDTARLKLKLNNPLGVAENLFNQKLAEVQSQQEGIVQDIETIQVIRNSIENYQKELQAELAPRLAEVNNLLHQYEQRGLDFFDNTLRLTNIRQLLSTRKVQEEFSKEVLHDIPQQIDHQVQLLIDWLVTKDLNVWQQIMNALQQRQALNVAHAAGAGVNLQVQSRRELLDNIGKHIKTIVETYDRQTESEELANTVEQAIAQTALLEVGAVGMGVLVATALTSSALDITGTVAAGTLAVAGLFIIPYKKKQAKDSFREKMAALKENLLSSLEKTFRHESEDAIQRLMDNISPYITYVEGETARIQKDKTVLNEMKTTVASFRKRIDTTI